jgi:hypothetical protein
MQAEFTTPGFSVIDLDCCEVSDDTPIYVLPISVPNTSSAAKRNLVLAFDDFVATDITISTPAKDVSFYFPMHF